MGERGGYGKILTTEDLRARLAEIDAIPKDDLPARIDWQLANRAPWITIVCPECGARRAFDLTWGDVRFELEVHGELRREIRGICPKCAPAEDEADETPA